MKSTSNYEKKYFVPIKKKFFAYQKTLLDTFQVREGDSNLVRLHWKNQDVSFDIKAIGTYKIYFFLKRRC